VIERHLAVMAHADWIIDLGPGAGHDGGRIVFECTPADLVARLRREHPLVEAIERLLRVYSVEKLLCNTFSEELFGDLRPSTE
jgi:hypothetical protein